MARPSRAESSWYAGLDLVEQRVSSWYASLLVVLSWISAKILSDVNACNYEGHCPVQGLYLTLAT